MSDIFRHLSTELVQTAIGLHRRGWLLGTSGNLSAVVTADPLRMAITRSGIDKGELTASDILLIDDQSRSVPPTSGKPSDESSLHVAIVGFRGAGLAIEGFEMLKGLNGVKTHLHREWIPIIENSQDMPELAQKVKETLAEFPACHALVLHRHGLYTWGRDLREAKRHVEILEFLFEVLGRARTLS